MVCWLSVKFPIAETGVDDRDCFSRAVNASTPLANPGYQEFPP